MALAACKASMAVRSSSPSIGVPTSAAPSQRTPNLRAHGAVMQGLHMPGHSLQNVGTAGVVGSRLLPSLRGMPLRSTDEHKGYWSTKRRPGMAVVQASVSIGEVQEVKPAAKEVYYNVVVRVSCGSDVAKWYTTPGMYVDLIPVDSNFSRASAFFIASPPVKKVTTKYVDLEFLIADVSNTVANEIINSKPGTRIVVTEADFSGFNMSDINSIEDFESVLMFASSYGLGPFRALIEKGFYANKRKHAVLYTMYTPEQLPYVDKFPAWEATGVKIQLGVNEIISTNPAKTLVLLVASTTEQEKLAAYFESKGVPEDNIQTLFSGISVRGNAYYNKVLHKIKNYPKFPHLGEKHVSIELKI